MIEKVSHMVQVRGSGCFRSLPGPLQLCDGRTRLTKDIDHEHICMHYQQSKGEQEKDKQPKATSRECVVCKLARADPLISKWRSRKQDLKRTIAAGWPLAWGWMGCFNSPGNQWRVLVSSVSCLYRSPSSQRTCSRSRDEPFTGTKAHAVFRVPTLAHIHAHAHVVTVQQKNEGLAAVQHRAQ
jgi:hypothetical protein